MAIKVEENLKKKQESNDNGIGRGKDSRGGHRGGSSGKGNENRGQGDSKLGEKKLMSPIIEEVMEEEEVFLVEEEEDQGDMEELHTLFP